MSSSTSLADLPRELIYFIFKYLDKEHIAYSFLELNNSFFFTTKYFIAKQFNLIKSDNNIIFQYCLTTVLPSIGFNLRYLSIYSSYRLLTYLEFISVYCPNLDKLDIHCHSQIEDIRYYATYLINDQLLSLNLIYNNQIVDKQLSVRLLDKSTDEPCLGIQLSLSLNLHLSSLNDIILLKRFCESNYLFHGLYMIESVSTGQWLTDSKDDLCLISNKLHRESVFSLKQSHDDQCSLEYQLYNEQTQRGLTVLITNQNEEHWISSSILSTYRKESICSCSTFTFERIDNENQFYIRPCYLNAKRLQISGKRIIVSLFQNENTLNHRFRLHRIS